MNRKPTGRQNSKMISIRLDDRLDADLIGWLEAQPSGRRSEAVRDTLRAGLETQTLRSDLVDLVRQAVADALKDVHLDPGSQLAGGVQAGELESAFGDQLDRLLAKFS